MERVTDDQARADDLQLRVEIDAPPASVFKALTDPDDLAEWFAESAEVALDGGRYEFWGRYAPQGGRPRQTLQAAEPAQLLRYGWTFDEGPSTVSLTIAESPDGSVVTLRHDGIPGRLAETALPCFWYVSLANLAAFAEGLQTMPPFDFSVPAQGELLVRTVIDVPVEEVFASLLDPAQVDKWAGGAAAIEPALGGRYEFGWSAPDGPTRIVELDQDKALAYSWRYPDVPDTTVRWSLRGSRGSTYLTLAHTGFVDDGLAEQFRQGWPSFLVEVKRVLEQGDDWRPLKV